MLKGVLKLIVKRFHITFALVIATSFIIGSVPGYFFAVPVSQAQGGDAPPNTNPASGAVDVPVNNLVISATFAEPITFVEYSLRLADNTAVPGTLAGNGTQTVTFTPSIPLSLNTQYTVRILNITINGVPYNGLNCKNDGTINHYCWSFTTVAATPTPTVTTPPTFTPTATFTPTPTATFTPTPNTNANATNIHADSNTNGHLYINPGIRTTSCGVFTGCVSSF